MSAIYIFAVSVHSCLFTSLFTHPSCRIRMGFRPCPRLYFLVGKMEIVIPVCRVVRRIRDKYLVKCLSVHLISCECKLLRTGIWCVCVHVCPTAPGEWQVFEGYLRKERNLKDGAWGEERANLGALNGHCQCCSLLRWPRSWGVLRAVTLAPDGGTASLSSHLSKASGNRSYTWL